MNRRLFWSLLLALLLPMAQAAAAAHEVTHLRVPEKVAVPAAHCDVCAVAAAVTGGGAASEPGIVLHAPAREAPPAWQPQAPQTPAHVAHFLSRAPPLLH